jgi:thiol-disulfide isomerase/thioredoxin
MRTNKTIFGLIVGCLTMICAASVAHAAAPKVGQPVNLQFKAFGGEPIDISKYHGKLVLIDFWASWCGPCMAEADHMTQIYHRFGPQGLVIIGVDLDQSSSDMQAAITAHHFTWPQYYDGRMWKNEMATNWGVNSIPQTFLVSTDGTLLWRGHPAELDKPLAQAFEEHPPSPVAPEELKQADESLDSARKLAVDKQYAAAMTTMAHIPTDAHKDGAFAKRFGEVAALVDPTADEMIESATKQIDNEKFTDAAVTLKRVSLALAGTPSGKKAFDLLADLQRNPDAKGALDAADTELKAEDALAVADALAAAKSSEKAYTAYKAVADQYPGTAAAKTATDAVAKYDADPAFAKAKAAKLAAEQSREAHSKLNLGENYAADGRTDLARERFNEVIEKYPNTPEAEQAKADLDKLGN